MVPTLSFKTAILHILKRISRLKILKMQTLKMPNLRTRQFNTKHLKAQVRTNLVSVHLNQQLIHLPIKRRIQISTCLMLKNTKELKDNEERKENTWKRWSKRQSNIAKNVTTYVKSTDFSHTVLIVMMSIKKICLISKTQIEKVLFLTSRKINKLKMAFKWFATII